MKNNQNHCGSLNYHNHLIRKGVCGASGPWTPCAHRAWTPNVWWARIRSGSFSQNTRHDLGPSGANRGSIGGSQKILHGRKRSLEHPIGCLIDEDALDEKYLTQLRSSIVCMACLITISS